MDGWLLDRGGWLRSFILHGWLLKGLLGLLFGILLSKPMDEVFTRT